MTANYRRLSCRLVSLVTDKLHVLHLRVNEQKTSNIQSSTLVFIQVRWNVSVCVCAYFECNSSLYGKYCCPNTWSIFSFLIGLINDGFFFLHSGQ